MSLPLRGLGSGLPRTPASRPPPAVPRSSATPYTRIPSDASQHRRDDRSGGGSGNAVPGRLSEPLSGDICQKIFDELRMGREEQNGIRQDIRRLCQVVARLEENFKKLADQIKQQEEASFCIESSTYKDDLLKETAVLYVRSLQRQPSRQDVGQAIMKVLRQEGKNKLKFNKARTFVYNKLTDHRCEERRRLFAQRPCEVFGSLTTEEFADRFMGTVKAPSEFRLTYIRHLTLLRKFAQESQDARNDTFKKFRDWLDSSFVGGIPTEEEWRAIMEEDGAFDYGRSDYVCEHHDDHNSSTGGYIEEPNGEGGVGNYGDGGHLNSYNPEMLTF